MVNNSPENQHDFCRLKTVLGENSYSNIVKDHNGNKNNIVVFIDRIANFDRNTKVKKQQYSKWTSKTLECPRNNIRRTFALYGYNSNYDTAIVHVSINDIINNDTSTKVENLLLNLEKIVIIEKNMELKMYVYLAWFA